MLLAFHLSFLCAIGAVGLVGLLWWSPLLWLLALLLPLYALGLWDSLQTRHAILRNFPVLGHFRYLLELIRPEIQQYFIEDDTDGKPIPRELRSIVYARAKKGLQTLPFGTKMEVNEPGYEWLEHSLGAIPAPEHETRIRIGGEHCVKPYEASLLNISAMSYGSLSASAIRALNTGAKQGGFYHNTGEGGLSSHHMEPGGDVCWQIGTGYFGCRTEDGDFDADAFEANARRESVKLIELKLSQGAKPGHGGILPKEKITDEIAAIRGVAKGKDVLSPPGHSSFNSPQGLLEFVARLRELSGGKPVGFKLCVGVPTDFIGLCMAMKETGIVPDFISVDGGEGGTGAAPLEFSNSVGKPLLDGLMFVHDALTGFDLRKDVRLIASGKVFTAFDIAVRLALGADLVQSARGFMLTLGCIQALRCNSNHCPTGVATNRPSLERGLVVSDKAVRVAQWHKETVHAFYELLGAAGLSHPDDLRPWHIQRRVSWTETLNYARIHRFLEPGVLLREPYPKGWRELMRVSSAKHFLPLGNDRAF